MTSIFDITRCIAGRHNRTRVILGVDKFVYIFRARYTAAFQVREQSIKPHYRYLSKCERLAIVGVNESDELRCELAFPDSDIRRRRQYGSARRTRVILGIDKLVYIPGAIYRSVPGA